ncbi:MAG: sulfotransferase [Deltaproteobacteria bacterium]|nr:sulfotransferase [Deltaproteobacteria bacterium]
MKPAGPILVAGCGHSGTSLLLAIIGCHSNILPIPGETNFGFPERSDEDILASAKRFQFRAIVKGKSRWAEKTPRHIWYVSRLLALLPEARFVIIQRDGRDVACSLGKRHESFVHGIRRWVWDNALALHHSTDPRVLLIRYEELVTHSEAATRRICSFLCEEFEPAMLEFHQQPRSWYSKTLVRPPEYSQSTHKQYRNWQINQPIFDGRGRWKSVMTDEQKQLFKEEAGGLLISLGYAENNDW